MKFRQIVPTFIMYIYVLFTNFPIKLHVVLWEFSLNKIKQQKNAVGKFQEHNSRFLC